MNRDLEEFIELDDEAGLREILTRTRVQELVLNRAVRKAVTLGRARLIRVLIENGGRPDSRHEHTGWPLLHSAVEHGQKESVRELIELGADKNAVEPAGASALHLAIDVESDAVDQLGRKPDWGIVELLLELGVDPTIRDKDGRTAKDWADLAGIISPLNTIPGGEASGIFTS